MMNTWNTTGMVGFGSGVVWLHTHWFFGAFALVGFILLTAWAIKALSKEKLKSLSLWLLAIGIIGALLTAVPAVSGLRTMMNTWQGGMYGNSSMMNMMGAKGSFKSNQGKPAQQDDGHTAQEEAQGKVLWEQMLAEETDCGDLSDDDFAALGEYFMGLMMGNSHAAMNSMMTQMMGEEGEKQMHTAMGKRMSGCNEDAPFPSSMMQGGMDRLGSPQVMPMMGGGMMGGGMMGR